MRAMVLYDWATPFGTFRAFDIGVDFLLVGGRSSNARRRDPPPRVPADLAPARRPPSPLQIANAVVLVIEERHILDGTQKMISHTTLAWASPIEWLFISLFTLEMIIKLTCLGWYEGTASSLPGRFLEDSWKLLTSEPRCGLFTGTSTRPPPPTALTAA